MTELTYVQTCRFIFWMAPNNFWMATKIIMKVPTDFYKAPKNIMKAPNNFYTAPNHAPIPGLLCWYLYRII